MASKPLNISRRLLVGGLAMNSVDAAMSAGAATSIHWLLKDI